MEWAAAWPAQRLQAATLAALLLLLVVQCLAWGWLWGLEAPPILWWQQKGEGPAQGQLMCGRDCQEPRHPPGGALGPWQAGRGEMCRFQLLVHVKRAQ